MRKEGITYTSYTATLVDGGCVHAKTIAKLRRLAPRITSIRRDQRTRWGNFITTRWTGIYLDRLLKRSTKNKYRTKYLVDPVWIVSSDPLIVSTKVTPRLRLRIQRQSRSRRKR